MLQRAKEEPLVFCVLLELRYAEVIFLLHQCEKENRIDIFLATMKMLLPFYATTHAIKYVSMISHFLIDWHCSSGAEKHFSKEVLTKCTNNGRNVFTSRFIEWMVSNMRM